ncbi:metallophosphoesterase [Intrasporangium calvum]|uniref:Metallophosphoesterase n=2 Tax=Intrasporangium calvum TaxID=53358 RepID=E6S7B5_INTC7|nr:metallophosphoesterase [Intrasporangium calvum]ADU50078.1 metallophosphoesterase [Intrasporangium calvum DSM 43043]
MSVFVAVVAVLLALVTWALHRRLFVTPQWPYAAQLASAVVFALGWAAMLLAFLVQGGVIDPEGTRWLAWLGMTWLAVLWYLIVGTLVLGLVLLPMRLAGRRDLRRPLLRTGVPAVVIVALATTGYGLSEAADPAITPITITNDLVPAGLDGLRIALITDLHVGPVRDARFTERVVDLVNAEQPDLVVIAGDIADGTVAQVGSQIEALRRLDADLGVYGVDGNHEVISGEPAKWAHQWHDLGIEVLHNENVTIETGGGALTIAGLPDSSGGRTDGTGPDADAALAGVHPDVFTLLLAHQPGMAELVKGRGVNLQLSGHTHGGQLWPFNVLVRLQQPTLDGLAPVGDVPVLTSRGAGAWGPPVRVLAPPEIPLITLRTR